MKTHRSLVKSMITCFAIIIGNCNLIAQTYPFDQSVYATLNLSSMVVPAVPLGTNSYWNKTYSDGWNLSSYFYTFAHTAEPSYNYWDGFTMSTWTDNSNHGTSSSSEGWIANQWGCMAKGGVDGEGSPFLLGYWGYYIEGTGSTVETDHSNWVSFNDGNTHDAVGVYVCNSPWPYYGNLYGDGFARPFVQGDYFKLIAHGIKVDGTESDPVDFYLADYRGSQLIQVTQWTWMNLTSLGNVKYLYFTMESTDNSGQWGPNTAVYFCLDKLTMKR